MATPIQYDDVYVESDLSASRPPAPRTLRNLGSPEEWPLSLDDAIAIALANSPVIRDVGGRVVHSPQTATTIYDPELQITDPQHGPEAALSAFDAQVTAGLFSARNERTLNNIFKGGGIRDYHENLANFRAGITKTATSGTQFSLRHRTGYDRNNAPVNLFPSSWETIVESEVRHPLLQGAGREFNQIAGPRARPGVYRGVMLARLNTDVSLAEFELTVRDLLSEITRTYWELAFAYRNLEAIRTARDAALQTWRFVESQLDAGVADREQEALAREQYYAAKLQYENALNGVPLVTKNGSLAGPPSINLLDGVSGGVLAIERRLRFLLGLPASDGRQMHPADEPACVELTFDWHDSLEHSLSHRAELRKQMWTIRRRELELVAARNFLRPSLDVVGQYRWRGFGDKLVGNAGVPNGSAVRDLFSGNLQEWLVGVELSTPVGNRNGHAAVRNAKLALARERAIYQEQELQVLHELSAAMAELDRALVASDSAFQRRAAARQRVDAVVAKYKSGTVPLESVYDAQSRATRADSDYFRTLVDYKLAVSNVHFARGSLLKYLGVILAGEDCASEAIYFASSQVRHVYPACINYCMAKPAGPVPATEQPPEPAPAEVIPLPPAPAAATDE